MTDVPEQRGITAHLKKLRRRKIVQWGMAYVAASWCCLQGLAYVTGTFDWPIWLQQGATLVLATGLPIVLVIAWYHGDRGEQQVRGAEVTIITLLLVAAGVIFWRHDLAVEEDEAPHSTMKPAIATASVAVLPFVALSSGVDDGYFADGLSEEIINALVALPDLLVTARTSAFYFKGKDIPVPDIAEALGVAHIVEGSVRRSADKIRISAQLIRAVDGFHLWSATYDHSVDDVFAVQTRVAESVAGALGILLDDRKRAAMADVGVHDVESFIAYQRGVELFNRAHNQGPLIPLLERANVEFDVAIARKPDFAEAHFHHADLYAHFLIDEAPGKPPGISLADGIGVEEAARRLAKDFAAAHRHERNAGQRLVVQALQTTISADWRKLAEQIERAFASWDNCRHGLWIDQTAMTFGYGELTLAHYAQRALCDPIASDWTREAIFEVWMDRPADGLAHAERTEALRGSDPYVIQARVLAYLALGHLTDAEALLATANLDAPDVPEFIKLLELQVPAASGRVEEWQRLKPSLEHDPERLLIGAAVFGDRETANRTASAIDAMTLAPMILLRITDRCGCGTPFDLEATPQFARLLREANLPWSPPAPILFPLKTW